MEVKFEKGLGKTIDVVIYDGVLRQDDIIVIGSLGSPIVTKVRALFEPAPLSDMRDKKTKFKSVEIVSAATGVKISAPGLDYAISGMPIVSCNEEDVKEVFESIKSEVEEVIISTDKNGIIVKA